MEKNQTEVKPDPTENRESLWARFEKTGSIQAFLLYRQKSENSKEVDKTQAPS